MEIRGYVDFLADPAQTITCALKGVVKVLALQYARRTAALADWVEQIVFVYVLRVA